MQFPNTKIAWAMNHWKTDEAGAIERLTIYEHGRQAGRDEGRAQAQRHFQLALGLVEPTMEEYALWNNPVPLMVPEVG